MKANSNVVWVAGASGLVGQALLEVLARQPPQVHALLRRPQDLPPYPRLTQHRVDFARADLGTQLPAPTSVYIALGTTIAQAGSQEAFRSVDLDAVLTVARAARAQGASRCAVVSALGADPKSAVFYNRVKGEMEQALAQLGFARLVIARPSLLVGDRAALGQTERAGERWALRLSGPLRGLIPKRWRPIAAGQVASAMALAMEQAGPGLSVLESAPMQDFDAQGNP